MIAIDDVLIANDVVEKKFVCNLNACKGACCWLGDYGAPVLPKEVKILDQYIDIIREGLSDESKKMIDNWDWKDKFTSDQWDGAALHPDGSCVFLIKNEIGISMCGIEKAYNEGKIDFKKPLSCHLYPIRVNRNPELGFEAWNYDEWDICSAACSLGNKLKVPVYKFLKEAIIRAKGEEFYDQLAEAAEHHFSEKP